MQIDILEKYLPPNALPILKNWFGNYIIHIKITRERSSKLGDYQKVGENKFVITINHNLQPELFFFVFTHEMAHLFAFEKYGRKTIAPHGKEWKDTFRRLLVETLNIYSEEVQSLILDYAVSPKANFAASTGLKRHFYPEKLEEDEVFVEQLQLGEVFWFRETKYRMENRRRKNFLCSKVSTGQEYIFRPLIKVKKAGATETEIILPKNHFVDNDVFVHQLKFGECFMLNNVRYRLEKKRRINYLCIEEHSGKLYVFPPLIKVRKIS